jgi:hypothetical protein
MSFRSTVQNGVIPVPPDAKLPEGTEVEVTTRESRADTESFTGALLQIAAKTRGLPADLAENHDHYLHGLPKK